MKATKKNVAAAILEKHGHHVQLLKGDGYHYFTAADDCDWWQEPISHAPGSSVWVMYLGAFDLERWVAAYEELIEGVEVPEKNTTPKVIKLSQKIF